MSFPKIFKITIGLNDLGESYDDLLGFEMTTIIDVLK